MWGGLAAPGNGGSEMSPAREMLLRDARAAGYVISAGSAGETVIVRTIGVNGTTTRRRGIVIFDDGTAIRVDVDLSVAAGMRSYRDMRAVLGI